MSRIFFCLFLIFFLYNQENNQEEKSDIKKSNSAETNKDNSKQKKENTKKSVPIKNITNVDSSIDENLDKTKQETKQSTKQVTKTNINKKKTSKKSKEKNQKKKKKKSLKKFNIYSSDDDETYSLSSILSSQDEENKGKTNENKLSINFKEFLVDQIEKTNQSVIKNIYRYFLTKNTNIFDSLKKEKKTKRKILLHFLKNQIDKDGNIVLAKETGDKTVPTQKINIVRSLGGSKNQIKVNSSTLFNFYEITKGNMTNKIADLVGGVKVEYDNIIISANRIRVNITAEILVAHGNILIQIKDKEQSDVVGKTFFFDIQANKGLVLDAKGRHEKYYYNGEKLKMNDTDHFTLEKGNISFGDNSHIYYSIKLDHFNFYDDDDFFLEGMFYHVHNHPFFWLPRFIQTGKISTSLNFNFGRSEREGYYVTVNNFNLVTPFFTPANLEFQLAQRLGFLLQVRNQGSDERVNYNLDGGMGYFYKNVNTSRFPLRYTYHDGFEDTLFSEFGYYVKLKYRVNIINNSTANSQIDFQFDKFSKPYFSSIFKNNSSFPPYEIEKLYDKDEGEQYYNAFGKDKERYKINYSLSSSGVSLNINNDWVHDIYEDPELPEEDEEKYISYLKTLTFPSISVRHSGFFDLFKIATNENFSINYSVGFKYSILSRFKDGQKKGDGNRYTNIAPFKLINKEDSLSVNASTSKSFNFDFGTNQYINWITFGFSPSISWKYSIKKETEKNDTIKYAGKNVERNYYNSGLSGSIAILQNRKFIFDLNISSGLTYNLENFKYREDIDLGLLKDQLKGRSSSYSYSLSGNFNFPSGSLSRDWRDSYGLLSTLPTLTIGLSYNLGKYNQKITNDNIFFFPLHSSKGISGSANLRQKGYGFLFIRHLDSDFNSSLSFSYDMKPTINSENEEEEVVLDEKLFRNVSGGSTFNLRYNPGFTMNNSLQYDLYDVNEKKFTNIMKTYRMSMGITLGTNIIDNEYISFKSLNLSYNWNYHFRTSQYLQDRMGFSIGMNIDFFDGLLNTTFSTGLANSDAYLYFEEKTKELGVKRVSFIGDLLNFINVFDISKLQQSLFKFSGISVSVQHDLREWFMTFSYSISPVALNNVGSLKGFYLNQKVSLNINLKEQYNPIDGGGKFIPVDELEETIIPKEFKD